MDIHNSILWMGKSWLLEKIARKKKRRRTRGTGFRNLLLNGVSRGLLSLDVQCGDILFPMNASEIPYARHSNAKVRHH